MSARARLVSLPLLVALVLPLVPEPLLARVKLITLPVRERVEIQLDHPSLSLVEEQRVLPLVAGVNEVDFSWANTRIDPSSLVLRLVDPAAEDGVELLSVSYPPGEQALVWQVSAARSTAGTVRISYVLGELRRRYSYRAVATRDEATLDLAQYLHVENYANEGFGRVSLWPGFGPRIEEPVGEDESRRLLLATYREVPVRKAYSCNPGEYGYRDEAKGRLRVPMHYVLRNDRDGGLGVAALPAGKLRIFQDDGRAGTAFIGEDWGRPTPLGEELRLYLGEANDVTVQRRITRRESRRVGGNVHEIELELRFEIENFKDRAVTLEIGEDLRRLRNEVLGDSGRPVDWELLAESSLLPGLDRERSEQDRLLFRVDLPARADDAEVQKTVHTLRLKLKNEW